MSNRPLRSFVTPLTIAAVLMSLNSPLAMASGTRAQFSPQQAAKFQAQMQALLNKDASELHRLMDVRDAKGNSRFYRAQKAGDPNFWPTFDPAKDGVEGTAVESAYAKYGAGTNEIIVAVLDSGGDTSHEDIASKIWTNPKEIPDNGIDDDGNGYIDDVHGWNFLGGKKDGKIVNIIGNTLEVTREYARMLKERQAGTFDNTKQAYFDAVEKTYKEKAGDTMEQLNFLRQLDQIATVLEGAGMKPDTILTEASINAIQSADQNVTMAKQVMIQVVKNNPDKQLTTAVIHQAVASAAAGAVNYDLNYSSSAIVGDNPAVLTPPCAVAWENEKQNCIATAYGNNDVTGADKDGSLENSMHGTHVAGIIGAIRNNGKGMNGQADKVKIMHVRMVPDGDEKDNDIALAIRYAADNGAKVINMSFGKPLSPGKKWIDEAVKYAETKGVILVHAAGNEHTDTTEASRLRMPVGHFNFPNKNVYDAGGNVIAQAPNWIEVGASSSKRTKSLPASFSNFGKTSVDLFGPGVQIYATVPGNSYANLQGTSMASPEVAGVVAYLMTVFPKKTSAEIAQAVKSTTTQYGDLQVSQPGAAGNLVAFSSLSISGGIVNAFEAAKKLAAPKMAPVTTKVKGVPTKKAPAKKQVAQR